MFVISPLWHPFSIFPRQILPFRSLFLSKPTCRFFSFVCGKAAQIEQQTEQRPRWPPPLLQFPLSSTFLLTLKWLWGPSLLSLPSHPLVSTFATRRSSFPKRKSNAKSLMPLRKVFYCGCIFQMHFDTVCTVLPRERAHWDNTNKQRMQSWQTSTCHIPASSIPTRRRHLRNSRAWTMFHVFWNTSIW